MKRILPAIAALAFCSPAFAGLALPNHPNLLPMTPGVGKGNDCKVSFDGARSPSMGNTQSPLTH